MPSLEGDQQTVPALGAARLERSLLIPADPRATGGAQPYQRPVRRAGEPAVVVDPLVQGGGVVADPLDDIMYTDDVCGLDIEGPREGDTHLTKDVQPEALEVSHRRKQRFVPVGNGRAKARHSPLTWEKKMPQRKYYPVHRIQLLFHGTITLKIAF